MLAFVVFSDGTKCDCKPIFDAVPFAVRVSELKLLFASRTLYGLRVRECVADRSSINDFRQGNYHKITF